MADFLTTTFPVILLMTLGSENGREERLYLHLHPEFKRYNVTLWEVVGSACHPYDARLLKWRTAYVESSDIIRLDHLHPGRYCVMADPITDMCWPPDFCSRITSDIVELNGFANVYVGAQPCCYSGKVEATFQTESDFHMKSVHVSVRLLTLRNPCFTRFGVTLWRPRRQRIDCGQILPSAGIIYDEVLPNTTLSIYELDEGQYCLKVSVNCRGCSYDCRDVLVSPFEIRAPDDVNSRHSVARLILLVTGAMLIVQGTIVVLHVPAVRTALAMWSLRACGKRAGRNYIV